MDLEEKRKSIAEQLWLHYFNQVLFRKNLISEAEANRLALMIDHRKLHSVSRRSEYNRLT